MARGFLLWFSIRFRSHFRCHAAVGVVWIMGLTVGPEVLPAWCWARVGALVCTEVFDGLRDACVPLSISQLCLLNHLCFSSLAPDSQSRRQLLIKYLLCWGQVTGGFDCCWFKEQDWRRSSAEEEV